MAGTTSVGADTLSDAGKGAALGSLAGPEGALIGGVVGAGYGLVSGLIQKNKAKKLLAQNPYPNMPVPAEELAAQQEAQNMATEGMPSAQYQQANKNIQRQQAAAIADAQNRRSGVAGTPAIQQETNDATANLDANSAAIRQRNQLNLQTVNSQVAGFRNQAFDWNSKNKYLQNYQYGMSLLGQGNANVVSGADKLLGTFTRGAASGLFQGTGSGNSSDVNGGVSGYNGSALPALANTSSGPGSPAGLYDYINPGTNN